MLSIHQGATFVSGGAAYANRNPLFRSPGRGHNDGSIYPLDDNTTTTSDTSNRSSDVSSTILSQGERPWPLARKGNRGHGSRPALHQSPREIDTYDDDDTSDTSGATRMSDLSNPMKDNPHHHRNGRGGSRNGSRKTRQPTYRSPREQEHHIDDSTLSDISEMLVVQKPSRNVGGGLYNGVGEAGGKSGGGRSRGGGGDIGASAHGGGGDEGATAKGIEPAVKGCGCMSTTTFAKLVRLF